MSPYRLQIGDGTAFLGWVGITQLSSSKIRCSGTAPAGSSAPSCKRHRQHANHSIFMDSRVS